MDLVQHVAALKALHGDSVKRKDLESYSKSAKLQHGVLAKGLPKLKRGTYDLTAPGMAATNEPIKL